MSLLLWCGVEPALQRLGVASYRPSLRLTALSLEACGRSAKHTTIGSNETIQKTCISALLPVNLAPADFGAEHGWCHCIKLQSRCLDRREECVCSWRWNSRILLLFTAQRAAPRRDLTLPACKLLNPTGITAVSHGFVSMAFDCPMWICFYGLWFPFESIPVDLCEWIPASTGSTTPTWIDENLSVNGNCSASLFVCFKGKASFIQLPPQLFFNNHTPRLKCIPHIFCIWSSLHFFINIWRNPPEMRWWWCWIPVYEILHFEQHQPSILSRMVKASFNARCLRTLESYQLVFGGSPPPPRHPPKCLTWHTGLMDATVVDCTRTDVFAAVFMLFIT